MMNARNLLFLCLVIALFAGCEDNLDTPTAGTVNVAIDESFSQFMDSEAMVFQGLYSRAHLNTKYVSESAALKALVDDSAKIVIVARPLNDQEVKYFESLHIKPRTTKIATDAIALIINPANKDTSFSMQQLANLFGGKVQNWKDLSAGTDLTNIQVVFDNQGSSTSRYIKEKFGVKELPPICSAVKSNAEVVNYVATHKEAIGVIGVNWISDTEDTTSKDFLSKIQVARIIGDSTGPIGKQPYQAYIALKTYPLTRDVYVISREIRAGLGTGFASFIAGDKGQRIILKSGLMPATQPVRILKVN